MNNRDMPPVAILAGGLATRLRPITDRIPKSLVELAGHPFLYHQILLLKSLGIRDIVLCVGHRGEMIRQRFHDGSDLGVHLQYSFDGDKLLGTAGALRRALPMLNDEFFVLYGDSYLTCDFREVASTFHRCAKSALMTVFRNEGKHDTSNIEYRDGRIVRYDKEHRTPLMQYIDYGLAMFQRRVFAGLPDGQPKDLAQLYQELLTAGELAAFEVADRFYEIGSMEGLRETAEFLHRNAKHPGERSL